VGFKAPQSICIHSLGRRVPIDWIKTLEAWAGGGVGYLHWNIIHMLMPPVASSSQQGESVQLSRIKIYFENKLLPILLQPPMTRISQKHSERGIF
jgi:hypothetical protein